MQCNRRDQNPVSDEESKVTLNVCIGQQKKSNIIEILAPFDTPEILRYSRN